MIPVILSGGSGSRLWPQSRRLYPKQFLPLVGEQTMIQETVARLKGLKDIDAPLVVCNEEHRFMAAEQLRLCGSPAQDIILEPVGRNTAPAIALAALKALQVFKELQAEGQEISEKTLDSHLRGNDGMERQLPVTSDQLQKNQLEAISAQLSVEGQGIIDEEPLLLVLAADHVINDVSTFHAAIEIARQQALAGKLVTFGIVPDSAETGYGYIRADAVGAAQMLDASCEMRKDEEQGIRAMTLDSRLRGSDGEVLTADSYPVAEFVEKPDLATAEKYLACGEYYWNSGMFMFTAARFIEELEKFNPAMLAACREALAKGAHDLDFTRLDKTAFENCPSDSVDYAVMEPLCESADGSNLAVVVPLDAGWSDVGSWSSLWDVSDKDSQGNSLRGDVLVHDSRNCYVQGDGKLVAIVGLDDVVVVETDDSIMVAAKDRVQDVKKIVETLKAQKRTEADLHRKVYRPWGFYDSIDNGERFQVKRIVVSPGAQLSLQMHYHRAEHWIVVSGTAKVTRGEDVFIVAENESTFISLGTKHRLENPGSIPLEMIEVQSGSYLGEDDIVRFKDVYGRERNS